MSEPLVTITMSAFNTENYIAEAINSVINQTYNNLEVLITDDGSTDNTKSIIAKFASKDSRIRPIYLSKNAGMNSAIGNMYSQAKGSFIGSVDSDDKIYPQCIEKCLKLLQQNTNAGMVHTHSEYFGSRSGKTFFNYQPFKKELFFEYLPTFHFRLFRANLWDHIKQFGPKLEGGWDVELSMKLSLITEFIELPEILYSWRQHTNQHHISEESKTAFKLLRSWYKEQLNLSL